MTFAALDRVAPSFNLSGNCSSSSRSSIVHFSRLASNNDSAVGTKRERRQAGHAYEIVASFASAVVRSCVVVARGGIHTTDDGSTRILRGWVQCSEDIVSP